MSNALARVANEAPAAEPSAAPSDASDTPPSADADAKVTLPGSRAQAILEQLPHWGDVVTIVLHGGCVFEYKGPFPPGEVGRGFYNLKGTRPGFEGHIKLDAIDHIGFQDRQHAGRIAHALTFNDKGGRNLFKVFLGRDEHGEIWPQQIERYEALRQQGEKHS
ncbi:MAG: heme utilization cystosolic carrier protein HutX [Halieaceae bacterium]|jgi:putative heme utilization carrier protein HutX|nr:heme utilization cystosolic carrier protein HutX [Halieaceae bacterium]